MDVCEHKFKRYLVHKTRQLLTHCEHGDGSTRLQGCFSSAGTEVQGITDRKPADFCRTAEDGKNPL